MFYYMSKKNENEIKLNELKSGIDKLKLTFSNLEKYLVKNKLANQNLSITVIRNLHFINNIIIKINQNIVEIEEITNHLNSSQKMQNIQSKELSKSDQDIVNKKFVTSFLLLESLIDVNNNFSIIEYDYEVMCLKLYENKKFIEKKNKMYIEISKLSKKDIVETFESTKVRIKEGFNFLDGVVNLIKDIIDGFEMIWNGMKIVFEFLTSLLTDFILLLYQLLKMLYNFIVYSLPKLFSRLQVFFENLWERLYKVGLFLPIWIPLCILISLYATLICTSFPFEDVWTGILEQLQLIYDGDFQLAGINMEDAKELLGDYELDPYVLGVGGTIGFIFSIWTFWYRTIWIETLMFFLGDILAYIAEFTIFRFKTLFMFLFNENDKSKIFLRSTPPEERLLLIIKKIKIEAPLLLFRALVIISIAKFLIGKIKYAGVLDSLISLRLLGLFPMLVIKDILRFTGLNRLLPPYIN